MHNNSIKLYRIHDQVFMKNDDQDDIPVSIVWLRPTTGWGKEVSLIGVHNEVVILDCIDQLDSDSRCIAEEELEKNYFYIDILRLIRTDVNLGNRYFEVETDRGKSRFVVKNPYVDIRPTGNDGVIIRDVVGNRFRIKSLSELDNWSRREFEKVN